jgi:plasmid stabilization system protein ParE
VTSRRVLISADAETQLAEIRLWWRENRSAAPDLFDREVDATVEALREAARSFPIYRTESDAEIRRALLPKSRFAIYFSIEPEAVLVVAVWHTARGSGPPMPQGEVPP